MDATWQRSWGLRCKDAVEIARRWIVGCGWRLALLLALLVENSALQHSDEWVVGCRASAVGDAIWNRWDCTPCGVEEDQFGDNVGDETSSYQTLDTVECTGEARRHMTIRKGVGDGARCSA